jgi:hypothetical protein
MDKSAIPTDVLNELQRGVVIPAFPLAIDENRNIDEKRQRALARYYLDAGAGGIAVGVHTTQFEIRLPQFNLFRRVLEIARDEFDQFSVKTKRPIIRVAGIVGQTQQAVSEAELAVDSGYHIGLLSLAALKDVANEEIIKHCKIVAQRIPIFGFYLQPAVGGRLLNADFWRAFAKIDNVVAIKIAPFNRYHTLDVVRGVAESGRADEIALYTGNDDNILNDLLTEYSFTVDNRVIKKRIVGGLLGQWAVWTQKAVQLLDDVHQRFESGDVKELLSLAPRITDANAAFFDAAHNFAGCIVGIHEVLRRQGLLNGLWTLNENETLSPGQKEEIDRVYDAYPELNDDTFVKENLHKWLN